MKNFVCLHGCWQWFWVVHIKCRVVKCTGTITLISDALTQPALKPGHICQYFILYLCSLPVMYLLCSVSGQVVRPAAPGGRKRARSNDVNTSQMPRGKRKCGLCGEEGKCWQTCHAVSFRAKQVMLMKLIVRTLHAVTTAVVDVICDPPLGHIWDMMLVWRKGNIEKTLCLAVLCTIIMVHKDTNSSYGSVNCIGLWSCLA